MVVVKARKYGKRFSEKYLSKGAAASKMKAAGGVGRRIVALFVRIFVFGFVTANDNTATRAFEPILALPASVVFSPTFPLM